MRSKEPLLFDCGAGTLLRLEQAGFSPLEIDAAVLSHLHLDHVSDLLALSKARWLMGECEIKIFGPEGTEDWFSKCQGIYPYLEELDASFHEILPGDEFSAKGFKITAAEAVHSVTALGYRVEMGSKSAVYSGDTEPVSTIADISEGADLLIHECSFPEPFVVTNHTTPRKLGETIHDVDRVVLTHLYPDTIGHEEEMVQDLKAGLGASARVEIGKDLQRIKV